MDRRVKYKFDLAFLKGSSDLHIAVAASTIGTKEHKKGASYDIVQPLVCALT